MSDSPLFLLAMLAAAAVLLILVTGIGGFTGSGDFNRRNANRLMRWRIIAQAVAFALMMLFLWVRG
ncbi:MAG: twin transmembrane helix small protein [Paracoccus sp. (in: a-proteobacteria)]|uniref:twin transmembrane helix small protein n=1 Tax=Paracoccus sp. TaxID=267 RepID=UPI0026E09CD0|nr:twin transmembrane helix small protein [Paracoccus sp. (in: a-proteobacteria)]MDO5633096.1 twin transmembrane helix small protein [Paracoccus sp. (in: a-proteobacteria)]